MVKLSRRVHRKSKRIYSKKSLKRGGGAYKGEDGTFLRRERLTRYGKASTLYKLIVKGNVFLLDFSVAELGVIIGFVTGPKKYTETLKMAFGITNDMDNNSAVITGMMHALFNGGNDKAITRKLKITKLDDNNFDIVLMTGELPLLNGTISQPPSDIGTFLKNLSDEQLVSSDS